MGRNVKESMYETLAKKYGMSIDQAKANVQHVVQMAKETGLEYHMDTLIQTNTFDAHRLTLFAKTKGLMEEMTERLLRAYFTESKHIGDYDTLTELAVEIGLNREEVQTMLNSNAMVDEVRKDIQIAKQIGVTGVPFFLINNKYALTGAQPVETFVEVLLKIVEKEKMDRIQLDNGLNCDDDRCSF